MSSCKLKNIIFVLLLLSLSGCNTSPVVFDLKSVSHGKTIGIWSKVSNPSLDYVGLTIFSNHQADFLPLSTSVEGKLNAHSQNILQTEGWEAVALNDDGSANLQTFGIKEALLHAKKLGLSYLVAIKDQPEKDFINLTPVILKGNGIYQGERNNIKTTYVSFEFQIYDVLTGKLKDDRIINRCTYSETAHYATNSNNLEINQSDLSLLENTMKETVADGLWWLGVVKQRNNQSKKGRGCSGVVSKKQLNKLTVPSATLAAKVDESLSAIFLTCSSPYQLDRDCSFWSGGQRKIQINGKFLNTAANNAGTNVLVMVDSTSTLKSLWDSNLALIEMDEFFRKQGLNIQKIRPVETLGFVFGYVLELDGDGYDLLGGE